MKKLMVVLAAMGFTVGAYAADAVKPDAKADAAKAAEMKKADADKDGKVTVAEYIAIYKLDEAAGKKADKNANGIIEVDEFVVVAPAAAAKK
ncbi:MAG: hypothetical protein WAX69_12905 [Victivallales bacterium]